MEQNTRVSEATKAPESNGKHDLEDKNDEEKFLKRPTVETTTESVPVNQPVEKENEKLRYHRHRNNQVQKERKKSTDQLRNHWKMKVRLIFLNSHQISQLKMKKQNLEKKLKRYNQDKSSKTRGS